MNEILIVGTGFSGSIMARKLAEEKNIKILLLEQRNHIAGNMYDEIDENGILIQKYGPHFINTNKYWIIKFLSKYGELVKHNTKLLSYIDNAYIRLPFNFETVQQLVGLEKSELLLEKFRHFFKGRNRVTIFELIESEDSDIKNYGNLLFEKAYRPYTSKQWGISAEQIDKSVLNRVQMSMSYDERYLDKDYQCLPRLGFTKLFENLTNHFNIELRLNCDALDGITLDGNSKKVLYNGKLYKQVIFTGAIDELFKYKYGHLPYRSLNIKYVKKKTESFLPSEIVSYPQTEGYTRSTEYRKINYIKLNTPYTVIATEYPIEYDKFSSIGNQPYYPIIKEDNLKLYKKYLEESLMYENLFLCGRLAEYKYYNMDAVIESTFEKYEILKTKIGI